MYTIRELAKQMQDILQDGIQDIAIWKEGKTWDWTTIDLEEEEGKKELEEIKAKDKNVLLVNGYYDYGAYTLQYIVWQTQRRYYEEHECPDKPIVYQHIKGGQWDDAE